MKENVPAHAKTVKLRPPRLSLPWGGAMTDPSLEEAPRDGAALFTRGSRNNDCELLRHGLLPFSCGQARGVRRD